MGDGDQYFTATASTTVEDANVVPDTSKSPLLSPFQLGQISVQIVLQLHVEIHLDQEIESFHVLVPFRMYCIIDLML